MKAHFSIIAVLLLITLNCFSQAAIKSVNKQKEPIMSAPRTVKKQNTKAPTSSPAFPLSSTHFKRGDSLFIRDHIIKHN